MKSKGRAMVSRVTGEVRADVAAEPRLKYLLVLTFALAGFFLWYRAPNFSRPDEFTRLIDAMVATNHVLADPSLSALQEGVTQGRTLGASFYLSALALLPAYLLALVTGNLDTIVSANGLGSRWEVWMTLPEWFWTTSLLAGRLLVVLLAVGCVYLTYRLGSEMCDRTTGLLAGLLLALSFSFLRSAHEFAEDVPALFCFLLGLVLAHRYVETGDRTTFLAGCAVGGLAIGFKVTAGTIVIVLGVAYLLRAHRARDDREEALLRLPLLAGGLALGAGGVVVGFPSVLVTGPEPLVERILRSTARKSSMERNGAIPVFTQIMRFYAGGLGISLALAAGGGVLASFRRLRERGSEGDGVVLILTALGVWLLVFSRWEYVQPHHLLPTFPLLAVLVAAAFSRLDRSWSWLARPLVAVLVLTSGVYAGVGMLGYTIGAAGDTPEEWMATEMPENATMDVYTARFQTSAPLHGRSVEYYVSPNMSTYGRLKGERWDQGGFTDWRYDLDERDPDYIQYSLIRATYLPETAREQYTVAARFPVDWPLRDAVASLGGVYSYPEFSPARPIVILERSWDAR